MRTIDAKSEIPGTVYGGWRVTGPAAHRGGGRALSCVCIACGMSRTIGKTYLMQSRVRCWGCKPRVRARDMRDPELLAGGPWAYLRDRAKRGADKRGILFSLTRAELKALYDEQKGRCALSGVELSVRDPKTASLDRKDSSDGYKFSNVQWVHKNVNVAKNTLSNDEFIGMCLAVAQHFLKRPL